MRRSAGEGERAPRGLRRGLAAGALVVSTMLLDGGVSGAASLSQEASLASPSGEVLGGADLDALAASSAIAALMGGVFLALGRRKKPPRF